MRLPACLCLFLGLTLPAGALAGPIYVYRGAGGVIHFSSDPPPAGVKAEVFTAKGSRYSVIGRGYRGEAQRLFISHYRDIINTASQKHRLDPALIRAVIHVESAFNPRAVSPKGAQGLMQLMPGTARRHGIRQPFDPNQNIDGGSRHLAQLLRRFNGDLKLSLAAYNAGEEAVMRYGGVPPYKETQEYIQRVLTMHRHYSSSLSS